MIIMLTLLYRLMNDLQNVYENAEGEIEYTVGKAYAVYSKAQKKWLRGSVLSKISEDKVQVCFKYLCILI